MEQAKRILKRIFCLPLVPTVLIAVPAFALVIYVLTEDIQGPLSYLSYIASAYALVISVIWFVRGGKNIRDKAKQHPLTGRYLKDSKYRTRISLYQGLLINLLYITVKLVSGIYYRSWWFVTLAVYYALLAVMRFLLIWRWGGIKLEAELRRYRLCGIMLLLMNEALAGMVILMVYQNRGYDYPGSLIYAMAAYSFYAVITAVIHLIKFRKYGSPVLSAAKAIKLVAAMVSILSLETAMLARFGSENDSDFRKFMTGMTGGCVCSLVLGMAVFMIAKSTKNIQQISKTYERDKAIWK